MRVGFFDAVKLFIQLLKPKKNCKIFFAHSTTQNFVKTNSSDLKIKSLYRNFGVKNKNSVVRCCGYFLHILAEKAEKCRKNDRFWPSRPKDGCNALWFPVSGVRGSAWQKSALINFIAPCKRAALS